MTSYPNRINIGRNKEYGKLVDTFLFNKERNSMIRRRHIVYVSSTLRRKELFPLEPIVSTQYFSLWENDGYWKNEVSWMMGNWKQSEQLQRN